MRTVSERPSLWHVIVTLAAMFYLSCGTQALTVALYPRGGLAAIETNVILSTAGAFLGILIILTWIFLLKDLIRQVSLFFRNRRK
jgi:hypothetical protein